MGKLIDADAAIDALTEYGNGRTVYIGVEEAVRRIEQLPSAQPDTTTHDSISAETDKNDGDRTSGDCISRQQSVDTLRKMQTYKLFAGDDMILIDKAQVQTELMMMPSAQPERPRGHWVETGDEPYDEWECDVCGFAIDGSGCIDPEEYKDVYKFCPNCGADMRPTERNSNV